MKQGWAALVGAALLGGGIGAGAFWFASDRRAGAGADADGKGGAMAVPASGSGESPGKPSGKTGTPAKVMYTCAMHPAYITDKPGNCPICGMTLVPVAGHSHGGEDGTGGRRVRIDSATLRNMGVRTALVEKRELAPEIRTSGKIAVDESRQASVNARVGGYVEILRASATGKTVRKGETLLELYSPELTGAQEEFLQALRYAEGLKGGAGPEGQEKQGGYASARELVESARRRLANWGVPEERIRALERGGAVQRTLPVTAPSPGVILEKSVLQGQRIEPGAALYRIADLSKVWVVANAYQGDLARVKVGAAADIALSYLPGRTFTGRVTFVSPVLDPETRTAEVRIEVSNTSALDLKPEMFATVTIKAATGGPVVAVPEQALIRTGRRDIAVVATGDGYFEPRDVKLGAAAEGFVQVLEGLSEGESLVVSSQFLIDSESNLKAAIEQMQTRDAAPGAPGNGAPGAVGGQDGGAP